jgi:hypothetical protein
MPKRPTRWITAVPTQLFIGTKITMNRGAVVGQCINNCHALMRARRFRLKRAFLASTIKETFSGCQI